MIEHINDATERTHRITGMPREEIVRRGLTARKFRCTASPAPRSR
jgi:hypothetical protein